MDSGATRVVLVVDDNRDFLDALAGVLRDEGYSVEIASNGEEAFMLACRTPIDVVLTDVVMPQVDGVELIRLMQGDPFLAHVPVVAMSAYADRHAASARQAGATACVQKTLRPEQLLSVLRRVMPSALPGPRQARNFTPHG